LGDEDPDFNMTKNIIKMKIWLKNLISYFKIKLTNSAEIKFTIKNYSDSDCYGNSSIGECKKLILWQKLCGSTNEEQIV
jgi:hypothetical protein